MGKYPWFRDFGFDRGLRLKGFRKSGRIGQGREVTDREGELCGNVTTYEGDEWG